MTIGIQRFSKDGHLIDENENGGVLRDHERLKVPLYLADGSPNPSLDPLSRSIGSHFDHIMIDANGRPLRLSDGTSDPLFGHRPGNRYLTTGDQFTDDARHVENLRRAYANEDRAAKPQQVQDSQHQALIDAYNEADFYAENSWRLSKGLYYDGEQQSLSFAVPRGPQDLWTQKLASEYGPIKSPGSTDPSETGYGASANQHGLRIGDPCMTDDGKERGVIVSVDGKLVCRALSAKDHADTMRQIYDSVDQESSLMWQR